MQKKALITGITGMSGSYMADLLLGKGYEVHGLVRRSSTNNKERIAHILDKVILHEGDVTDATSIYSLLAKVMPDEVYNFASQSHVAVSFKEPYSTFQSVAMGCLNFLEAIRLIKPNTKYFYAGSSESFGSNCDSDGFQRITTPMVANSPYAIGKIAAFNMTKLYRESYGMFAVSAICFNKEGPRRGETFVTRKITKYVGMLTHYVHSKSPDSIGDFPFFTSERRSPIEEKYYIKQGEGMYPNIISDIGKLKLGNILSSRDWSFSGDCCEGFWLQLQAEKPKDYVFSSMETHTVEDFLKESFDYYGFDWKQFVEIDPQFYRPCEVQYLKGDSTPARNELGWKPKISFRELVRMMVIYDKDKATK